LLLIADDLIHVVLTDKWSQAVPALQILCLYAFVRSLDILLPPVLMARFRAKFLFGYSFALLVVMPVAFLAGAIWAGAIGVAIAWVAVYPVLMLRMAQEAFREVGLSWRSLLQQLSSTLRATATMATVLAAIAWGLSGWPHDMAMIRLVLMVITGIAVYAGSLFLMDGAIYEELRQVIWWAIGKGNLKQPKALATA